MPVSRRNFMRIMGPLMVTAMAISAEGAERDDTLSSETLSANSGIMWKAVSRAGLAIDLVPTLHTFPRRARLPVRIAERIDASTKVFIEADPNDPVDRANAIKHCRYPAGDDVFKHLSTATAALVIERVTVNGIPVEKIKTLKPWAISILLQDIEQRRAHRGKLTSIEAKVIDEARQNGIPVEKLESIEQQFIIFDSFPDSIQDVMLRCYLQQNATFTETGGALSGIARAWLAGDVNSVSSQISALGFYPPEISAAVNETLVVERNRRFVDRILVEAQSPAAGPFVVAVGFNHFIGQHGMLSLLEQRGFAIDAA